MYFVINTSYKINMIFHMIVEQTKKYQKRICYDTDKNTFYESEYDSLAYVRKFFYPYGWIKESGTPPNPHWDVILMTNNDYELGQEVKIKIIGVFIRKDGDHKYIAVEINRNIDDFNELNESEKNDLSKLYPNVDIGEGWFGKEVAIKAMEKCEKVL